MTDDVLIKLVDMPDEMQTFAIDSSRDIMNELESQRNDSDYDQLVAKALKMKFDEHYGGKWQCIVGTAFGSWISHQSGHFFYFSIGDYAILLFKI